MGREIKRVDLEKAPPKGDRWLGYRKTLEIPECNCYNSVSYNSGCSLCLGTGHILHPDVEEALSKFLVPSDGGGYYDIPRVDPPPGSAYQVWETVSEGSPVSPAFATPEELAAWMATEGADHDSISYEEWLRFINGPGWAPSFVYDPEHGFRSGVKAVSQ